MFSIYFDFKKYECASIKKELLNIPVKKACNIKNCTGERSFFCTLITDNNLLKPIFTVLSLVLLQI